MLRIPVTFALIFFVTLAVVHTTDALADTSTASQSTVTVKDATIAHAKSALSGIPGFSEERPSSPLERFGRTNRPKTFSDRIESALSDGMHSAKDRVFSSSSSSSQSSDSWGVAAVRDTIYSWGDSISSTWDATKNWCDQNANPVTMFQQFEDKERDWRRAIVDNTKSAADWGDQTIKSTARNSLKSADNSRKSR